MSEERSLDNVLDAEQFGVYPDASLAPVIELPNAQARLKQLIVEAQQQAADNLPHHDISVIDSEPLTDAGSTDKSQFYQGKVLFSDGAAQLQTLAVPKKIWTGANGISPYIISGRDALFTGPDGFNRFLIDYLANLGYRVRWLHHLGPQAKRDPVQILHSLAGKSVGRSAIQHHAYLDHIAESEPAGTGIILGAGDSRAAMEGEAIDALAPSNNRTVAYSDYIGACFAHRLSGKEVRELPKTLFKEGRALGGIALSHLKDAVKNRDFSQARDMLGTTDMRVINLLHEIAWIPALMSGISGKYGSAIPLDRIGARTYMAGDGMSQPEAWTKIHSVRPGMRIFIEAGAHMDHSTTEIQQKRLDRYKRLMEQMREHDFMLPSVDFDYVIGKPSLDQAA